MGNEGKKWMNGKMEKWMYGKMEGGSAKLLNG
jgi:hypothetical protein